ncbi:hypothetical protein Ahy_B05g074361 [Arachis hypogaea]|uniref:Pentatricopeptide repeat-containing protein n=1 Tax=Arachis hypogaea TaxID=3818 RepID=A0A444YYN0_ARAHY|nr:hypothetical protein Ahy_B05g074361 [Arachis hypogaea]
MAVLGGETWPICGSLKETRFQLNSINDVAFFNKSFSAFLSAVYSISPKSFRFPITHSYSTHIHALKDRPYLVDSIRNLQNLDSALHLFDKMLSMNPLPCVNDFNFFITQLPFR